MEYDCGYNPSITHAEAVGQCVLHHEFLPQNKSKPKNAPDLIFQDAAQIGLELFSAEITGLGKMLFSKTISRSLDRHFLLLYYFFHTVSHYVEMSGLELAMQTRLGQP